jgi:hypothetical protein
VVQIGRHRKIHGEEVAQKRYQSSLGSVGQTGVRRIFYELSVGLYKRKMPLLELILLLQIKEHHQWAMICSRTL